MGKEGENGEEERDVHHIALGVPCLLAHVPVDLDELFKDGRVASGAAVSKAGRVVEVAIDAILVLVIRVLWTEQGLLTNVESGSSPGARCTGVTYRAYRTSKVVRVKLFVCVRVSECVRHDEQDLSKDVADADTRRDRIIKQGRRDSLHAVI